MTFRVFTIEFVVCQGKTVSVVEYNIVDNLAKLTCKLKQTIPFLNLYDEENGDEDSRDAPRLFMKDDEDRGICILRGITETKSDILMDTEFKSNNQNLDDINQEENYSIILFGTDSSISADFIRSLQWLSLRIVSNNDNSSRENKTTSKYVC